MGIWLYLSFVLYVTVEITVNVCGSCDCNIVWTVDHKNDLLGLGYEIPQIFLMGVAISSFELNGFHTSDVDQIPVNVISFLIQSNLNLNLR